MYQVYMYMYIQILCARRRALATVTQATSRVRIALLTGDDG
jgi:hypothetical protein